ncbi:hypothetical protein [Rhodovulum sulfidophilum]|uniref:Lipoprotein n=2 Tax=Rhodovulum sulfidophilum TaxID=35806 RepID=A0ABS1RRA0_RHOSU|nr:hypothetical protein [Rhodovulum sulfidophilum]MBL3584547.1 hypothetical protein [Rhodovulum sulfidophilum]MBL3608598.1 hypothetical protein [Rhodovulum sulfidophilum]MCE8456646.1 hypothetical protein [Rhodovulum sulfidophilum]
MKSSLSAALCAALAVSSCGTVRESRLNPFNWFSSSTETETAAEQPLRRNEVADPRPLVDQVTGMTVDRAPGGAILTVTGLPARQGFWDAALVPVAAAEDEAPADTLVFDFRIARPGTATPVGTEPSRLITAGRFISEDDLKGIRTLVVRGAQNQRQSRR